MIFYDLSNEINNKILINYLSNKDFLQNLSNKDKKKEKKNILNEYFNNKTKRFANDFLSIYHFNLKEIGKLIENLLFKKKEMKIIFIYKIKKLMRYLLK